MKHAVQEHMLAFEHNANVAKQSISSPTKCTEILPKIVKKITSLSHVFYFEDFEYEEYSENSRVFEYYSLAYL